MAHFDLFRQGGGWLNYPCLKACIESPYLSEKGENSVFGNFHGSDRVQPEDVGPRQDGGLREDPWRAGGVSNHTRYVLKCTGGEGKAT